MKYFYSVYGFSLNSMKKLCNSNAINSRYVVNKKSTIFLKKQHTSVILNFIKKNNLGINLRKKASFYIESYKNKIKNFKGSRHFSGLPVRGQRTRTNCRKCLRKLTKSK